MIELYCTSIHPIDAAHDLKILPCYYEAVLRGDKTFEIRNNKGREFQRGDFVRLHEIDPDGNDYTGNNRLIQITYVTSYKQRKNYVVLGLKLID